MKTDTKLYSIYLESQKSGGNKKLSMNIRYSIELQKILIEETNFLPDNATLSERLYCWLNDIHERQLCPYCKNKYLIYRGKVDKGYYATCGSNECKYAAIIAGQKKISLERKKEIAKKGQDTYFKRTGYRNVLQNPKQFKKLRKEFKEKYGAEYPLQVKEFKEKQVKTTLERYGTLDFSRMPKAEQTIIERYGSYKNMNKHAGQTRSPLIKQSRYKKIVERLNLLNFEILSYDDKTKMFKLKCKKCGLEFSIERHMINYNFRNSRRFCPKCDFKNMTFRSIEEQDLGNFINSIYKKEIVYNRKYSRLEFDICLPEEKIAFDYNGIYWHSTVAGKTKEYHINKKIMAKKQGFKLFYVWEDLWINEEKRKIIESNIKHLLGIYSETIYAKDCIIKEIDINDTESIKDIKIFLRKNDLEGNVSNGHRFFGMYNKSQLIMVAIISKTYNKREVQGRQYDYILSRLTTKINYKIIDGIDTMLKYITNLGDIDNMIYLVDMDFNDFKVNDSFTNNGFVNTKQFTIFNKTKAKTNISRIRTADTSINDNNALDFWDAGSLVLTYNRKTI